MIKSDSSPTSAFNIESFNIGSTNFTEDKYIKMGVYSVKSYNNSSEVSYSTYRVCACFDKTRGATTCRETTNRSNVDYKTRGGYKYIDYKENDVGKHYCFPAFAELDDSGEKAGIRFYYDRDVFTSGYVYLISKNDSGKSCSSWMNIPHGSGSSFGFDGICY